MLMCYYVVLCLCFNAHICHQYQEPDFCLLSQEGGVTPSELSYIPLNKRHSANRCPSFFLYEKPVRIVGLNIGSG